jgi:hypothetical protein
MKEIKKLTVQNNKYEILSREEFHRYDCGILTDEDFCTAHPTGKMVEKIDDAIIWTKKHVRITPDTNLKGEDDNGK